MKTILTFTLGVIATLIVVSYAVPAQNNYETQVITRTVTEYEPLDISAHRDVSQVSEHDEAINMECTYAIQRQTDEPLMGIVLYIEQHWSGDACSAYLHKVEHGWY